MEQLFGAEDDVVRATNLNFAYGGGRPILRSVSFALPRGARCLLLGSNGSGKTTLLRILAGKHSHPPNAVMVLGQSVFHKTPQTISFLGSEWATNKLVRSDIKVVELLRMHREQYPERYAELSTMLGLDEEWHMHRISDGERRRVQLVLGLVKPFDVLLLDEVTVDLDVVARSELLRWLRSESEQRGATIVYATHITDGLASWPTHIMHLSNGRMRTKTGADRVQDIPELVEMVAESRGWQDSPLLRLAEKWLREELEARRADPSLMRHQETIEERLAASTTSDRFYNYYDH